MKKLTYHLVNFFLFMTLFSVIGETLIQQFEYKITRLHLKAASEAIKLLDEKEL